MYTAYPDEPEVQVEEVPSREEIRHQKLVSNLYKFIETHSGADFGGITPNNIEKTQYTHVTKGYKRKGGKPPIDFSLTEQFVDLQLLVQQGQISEALPIYFHLRNLIA